MQETLLTEQDWHELGRLALAAGIGIAIGLNRDLRGKPTGMRTLGLVATGAALVSLAALRYPAIEGHADATSRVIQGILQGVMAGIGFVGAGVVLRNTEEMEVHGLTTAATVWMTAALGIACAIAPWHLVFAGVGVTLTLLVLLHPLEKRIERRAVARRSDRKRMSKDGET